MENAIEIRHLTKDYGSFKLDDVTFNVPMGTVVGLIGENGAGKSTTIKCILNLIRRDGGEITVFGRDNRKEERAVKGDIGVVLDEVLFLDTIQPREDIAEVCPKIKYLSVAHMFAEAIGRIYEEVSVSKLFV